MSTPDSVTPETPTPAPLLSAPPPAAQPRAQTPTHTEATPATAAGAAPATILLAEDDRAVRRYLEVILRRAGYGVVTAADGLEAMKAALSCAVDAVVTDALMPHLNGHELCRFLRRHEKLFRLPVVVLSGAGQQSDAPADGDHADTYLAKPVRPEELTGCLSRLLARAG